MPRSADDVHAELLALRCQRGDPQAWTDLVEHFAPRLTYYLGRFVSDPDEAGSLLQEVWLRALRGIKSLRDERRLVAWLYAIAHHVVMSHFRDEYARREQEDEYAVAGGATDDAPEYDRFDNAELVHHALGRIGWAEREVLTLMFLENLSVAQIAEVTGVPPGTVKSRLHRGRAELRQVIERETQSRKSRSHDT
jgi:RNA polymerase sigma factor (sigma-70 family)